MSTFKKAKVVMLPTNQKAKEGMIYLKPKIGIFNKTASENHNNNVYDCNPQHLYIISDDEIKEGDYILNIETNNIFKADSIEYLESHNIIEDFDKSFYINSKYAKKIIATTDTSLQWLDESEKNPELARTNGLWKCLPQPSQQFIEKYIKEYNKGNIITDVLIEYELISNEEYFGNTVNPDDDVPYFDEKLKINPKDNTIIIKKVKDSWNREEVENLIYAAMKDRCYTTVSEWRKWIEENL